MKVKDLIKVTTHNTKVYVYRKKQCCNAYEAGACDGESCEGCEAYEPKIDEELLYSGWADD